MALFVFGVSFFVFAASPNPVVGDAYPTLPTAISLVNHQTLSVDAFRHYPHVLGDYRFGSFNGHLMSTFPWAVSLFAIPAVVLLDIAHLVGSPSPDSIIASNGTTMKLVLMWSGSLWTAAGCSVLSIVAFRRLYGDRATRRNLAVICALIFAFGTSAWSMSSRSLLQHGPCLFLLSLGLLALDRLFPTQEGVEASQSPLPAFGAGIAFMAATAVRPTDVVPLLFCGVLILVSSFRRVVVYGLGILVVLIPWTLVTLHYYGALLQPYDAANRLGLPSTFFEAIGANLFSPARGLFIFSPIALIAIAGFVIAIRRHSATGLEYLGAASWIGYVIILGTVSSSWWAGFSYGPRYMSETLPFAFVLALPFVDWLRSWRASRAPRPVLYRYATVAVVVLAAFSILVNAEGGVIRASMCWNGPSASHLSVDQDPSRVWSWSDAQVESGFRSLNDEGIQALKGCKGFG